MSEDGVRCLLEASSDGEGCEDAALVGRSSPRRGERAKRLWRINVGGRTVIPIARVSYGFGAGGGAGESLEAGSERAGSGGGAGLSARPVGALEITEAGTRFIPFIDPARLGIALAVGFLIGLAISRRSARRVV